MGRSWCISVNAPSYVGIPEAGQPAFFIWRQCIDVAPQRFYKEHSASLATTVANPG
jgi:hypothetical protein